MKLESIDAIALLKEALFRLERPQPNGNGGAMQLGGVYWRLARVLSDFVDPMLDRVEGLNHAVALRSSHGVLQRPKEDWIDTVPRYLVSHEVRLVRHGSHYTLPCFYEVQLMRNFDTAFRRFGSFWAVSGQPVRHGCWAWAAVVDDFGDLVAVDDRLTSLSLELPTERWHVLHD